MCITPTVFCLAQESTAENAETNDSESTSEEAPAAPTAAEQPSENVDPATTVKKSKENRDNLDELEEDMEQDFEARAAIRKKVIETRHEKPENAPIVDKLEEVHAELSDDIVGVADGIDSFFVTRDVVDSRNTSHIRLGNAISMIEGEGVKNDFDFKLRLRLPQLKEKLQLEFEDDFYDSNDGNTRASQYYSAQQRDARSRGGFAYYENLKGFRTKLTAGLEYDHEVIVFGRFRIFRDFIISPKKKITFIHDYFDDTRDRKGQRGVLYYDYAFNKRLTLRFLNEELYQDEFNTFETGHGLSLFQKVDDRRFMAYNYRVNSLNPGGQDTFYLNSHVVSVVYRHRLFKKHLFGEVGPAVIWPKDKDFEGQLALTIRFELIIGNI